MIKLQLFVYPDDYVELWSDGEPFDSFSVQDYWSLEEALVDWAENNGFEIEDYVEVSETESELSLVSSAD
jgi:hypothetical protein